MKNLKKSLFLFFNLLVVFFSFESQAAVNATLAPDGFISSLEPDTTDFIAWNANGASEYVVGILPRGSFASIELATSSSDLSSGNFRFKPTRDDIAASPHTFTLKICDKFNQTDCFEKDIVVNVAFESATKYTLTVNDSMDGGLISSSPSGINCGRGNTDCSVDFDENTQVSLEQIPALDFIFTGWSGDCSGTGACDVTMSGNKNVTAAFIENTPPTATEFTLTVNNSTPSGGVITSTPAGINCGLGNTVCAFNFDENTAVSLTQTPANGYSFSGWSGDCSGTGACDPTLSSDNNVSAGFSQDPPPTITKHTLNVINNNPSGGLITSTPAGIFCGSGKLICSFDFEENTQITLNLTLEQGYSFSGWSGDCSGTGVCDVTLNSDKSVSAGFSKNKPVISSISPSSAILNKETSFLVKGTNLTDSMMFFLSDCSIPKNKISFNNGGSNTEQKFTCIPRYSIGNKSGVIKSSDNTLEYNFSVDFKKQFVVVIDPGHGERCLSFAGKTATFDNETKICTNGSLHWNRPEIKVFPDKIDSPIIVEPLLVLDIAINVKRIIVESHPDWIVHLTKEDRYMRDAGVDCIGVCSRDLKSRILFSNEKNADLFISIHTNGSTSNPLANGTISYYRDRDDKNKSANDQKVSKILYDNVTKLDLDQGNSDCTTCEASWYILNYENKAIKNLLEVAYHSNNKKSSNQKITDAERLSNPLFRKKVAEKIVDSISEYLQ